ncbi:MAG TPA: hypothetical protein VHB30_02290, partial [Solirubrobacteraceae bacterium]|nr:hypothetical protein [Solirubrobacteraceae bacterium]
SWEALAGAPGLAAPYAHLVALDPPAEPAHEAALAAARGGRTAHLAWGEPELAFSAHVHVRDLDLRAPLRDLYRALRDAGHGALADVLAQRPPRQSGRALRVLRELGLVVVDGGSFEVPEPPGRTELERSESFRRCQARLEEGRSWLLSRATAPLAA